MSLMSLTNKEVVYDLNKTCSPMKMTLTIRDKQRRRSGLEVPVSIDYLKQVVNFQKFIKN